MGNRIATICFITMAAVTAGRALAQTGAPPTPVPTGETVLATPDIELQVGPRFWYLIESQAFSTPSNNLSFSTTQSQSFPMAGGTLSARFATIPNTTFILSALYGKTTFSQNNLALVPAAGIAGAETFTNHVNRYDIEFLAQTAVPDTSWGWILGLRWEHENVGSSTSSLNFKVTDTSLSPFAPILGKSTLANSVVTAKAGVAGAIPITASGDLRLFANIMALAGGITDSGSGVVGPDMSVGLQYVVSPGIVASARYRGIFEFLISAPPGSPKYAVLQGPLIDLTFKF